jgi:hypothetical protein
MNPIGMLLLLVIGPALAIFIGCVGVEILEETILGWVLLALGVGYPPGTVIYYRQRRNSHRADR